MRQKKYQSGNVVRWNDATWVVVHDRGDTLRLLSWTHSNVNATLTENWPQLMACPTCAAQRGVINPACPTCLGLGDTIDPHDITTVTLLAASPFQFIRHKLLSGLS